jgi:hypothetical protein
VKRLKLAQVIQVAAYAGVPLRPPHTIQRAPRSLEQVGRRVKSWKWPRKHAKQTREIAEHDANVSSGKGRPLRSAIVAPASNKATARL